MGVMESIGEGSLASRAGTSMAAVMDDGAMKTRRGFEDTCSLAGSGAKMSYFH